MKKNKLLTTTLALLLCIQAWTIFPTHSSTYSSSISNSCFLTTEDSEIQSSRVGWKYKKVNGKTYKRLFDYSKNRWIGDWILVP